MKPTTTILIGAPLTGVEARVLRELHGGLQGAKSLIFANFETRERQIDFVVVTDTYAALVELKNFPLPIFGQQNGVWIYEDASGQRLAYSGENPWQQTKHEKFALSDEMRDFYRQHRAVPSHSGSGYFTQFDAFVCIYPEIHRDSQVMRGDHKVAVASYHDVLDALRIRRLPSTWSIGDWERFGEQHLHLCRTTLDEATSPKISEASQNIASYRTRLQRTIGTVLPPLYSTPGQATHGQELLAELLEPRNFILLGPSGSTKTFHLHHLALAISHKGEELPLLVEARRYRGGDFWSILRQGTAPYFREDPKALLEALGRCGLKPVLMVDALNECTDSFRADLLRGVQTFVLHHGGRVIFTSQSPVDLPGDLAAQRKDLPLPSGIHKRNIYAYHAGVPASPELERLCSGFTNAYDLTIAGRCHGGGVPPESRIELYDRYVRRCIPANTTVSTALLRALADKMSAKLALALDREEFEITAEEFLAAQDCPLGVIDELRSTRLIQLTDDSFCFEHEALFDYFKAEYLRRRFKDVKELAAELRRPRYQDLVEFLLPRFSAPEDIREVLRTAEVQTLERVLQGACGSTPQKQLLAECEILLEEASRDLPNIKIQCQTLREEDGRIRFAGLEVLGNRSWDSFAVRLCHLIALNLDLASLQSRFLELLNLTEWSLRAAVHAAAIAARFDPSAVWSDAVRLFGGPLQFAAVKLPGCKILSTLHAIQMFPRHFKQGLPIRAYLMDRVRRTPESHFSLLAVLEDLKHGDSVQDVRAMVSLVKRAWDSQVYILRVSALELLQHRSLEVHETAPEELPQIRAMLNSFDTNDIMVNTALLEALSAYDCLEPQVCIDSVVSELTSVIDEGAASDPATVELAFLDGISAEQVRANRAYGLLSNIFEDIFQGVYYEAYNLLSEEQKRRVLCLAANATTPGFFTDWILRELLRYGGPETTAIFERFASGPDGTSPFIQQSVAVFALGVVGCAKRGGSLPPHREDESPDIQAWRTIAEILFFDVCGAPVPVVIWHRLTGQVGLAAGDVLCQLYRSLTLVGDQQGLTDLVVTHRHEIRPIIESCLGHRDELSSIFQCGGSRDHDVVHFLISRLGSIGDAGSIAVLAHLADDPVFGKFAIQSIQEIQKRLLPTRV